MFIRNLSLFLCLLTLVGCGVAYEETAIRSWDRMANGQIDEALADYDQNVSSKEDQLLRLMDEGILLRVAERFEESNQKFLKAADIIEQAGYVSISEQAVTLLTNEKQTVYQGEDFEKTLVHVYLALNFMSLGNWESALVEARRVNEILYQMIYKGERPYEQNSFAQYLSSLIYEKSGEINSAYIDLKKIYETNPALVQKNNFIKKDLLRLSHRLRFEEDFGRYKKDFGDQLAAEAVKASDGKFAQVVLLLETGKSPRKHSSREKHYKTGKGGTTLEVLIPVAYYRERASEVRKANLIVGDIKTSTSVLNSIEQTAIQHLQDRMGRAIAKALLTAGVKAGVATGIGKATNSTELGLLAGLALFAMSEADTRSWLLLPGDLQVARVFVPPGKYSIEVILQNKFESSHPVENEKISEKNLKANEIFMIQRRSFF